MIVPLSVLLLSGCACLPWGDVQEQSAELRRNDSLWERYNPVLGFQCLSLTPDRPVRKPKEAGSTDVDDEK